MKILRGHKDGGPESNVRCWGIEVKGLFSIMLLCFGEGSREAFHSHAFNSISWLLKGGLEEIELQNNLQTTTSHVPSIKPIMTYRETFHQVRGGKTKNWVLTFRGPWCDTWKEKNIHGNQTLTHGRKVLETETPREAARRITKEVEAIVNDDTIMTTEAIRDGGWTHGRIRPIPKH